VLGLVDKLNEVGGKLIVAGDKKRPASYEAPSGEWRVTGGEEKSPVSPATNNPLPAAAPKVQVFVLGIPPMARWWEGAPEKNSKIQEINSMLAKGAQGNGYRFIELESVLADENGFLRGDMTSDGVHLSAKGYVAVLEKMKNGPLRGR
jgi:hypothetical protein